MYYTKKNSKGYTFVELLVVMAIISILSTLGMVYFFWQIKDSRDVVRVTDLKNMAQVLELHFVKKASYPIPDNNTEVTYEDTTVWYQWVYGDDTYKLIKKLNEKPLDPSTDTEYSYSILKNKKEFELSTIFEGEIFSYIPWIATAHAAEKSAYTLWTYNKKISVVKKWQDTFILALPSITASSLENPDIQSIVENNDIVIHGWYNLPANYNDTIEPQSWWVDSGMETVVIYSWKIWSLSTAQEKKLFIQQLQETYRDSPQANWINDDAYKALLSIDIHDPIKVQWYLDILTRKNIWGFRWVK